MGGWFRAARGRNIVRIRRIVLTSAQGGAQNGVLLRPVQSIDGDTSDDKVLIPGRSIRFMDRRAGELLWESGVKAMRCKDSQRVDSGWESGISWGLILLALLSATLAAKEMDSAGPGAFEKALGAVQDCMARSPAPWPDAWQREYLDTIRRAATPHPDGVQYAERLAILSRGFRDYWEAL